MSPHLKAPQALFLHCGEYLRHLPDARPRSPVRPPPSQREMVCANHPEGLGVHHKWLASHGSKATLAG